MYIIEILPGPAAQHTHRHTYTQGFLNTDGGSSLNQTTLCDTQSHTYILLFNKQGRLSFPPPPPSWNLSFKHVPFYPVLRVYMKDS